MKRFAQMIAVLFLVLVLAGTLSALVIKNKPVAEHRGSSIVLKWSTLDESGVQRFEVMRSSGFPALPYMKIGEVAAKGFSASYEFTDNEAYKTSGGIYRYKIRVINGQDPAPETEEVVVSSPASAAKRTWGSIKAMFR